MKLMPRKMRMWICLACVLGISSLTQAVEWQEVAGELMSPACPGRTLINCTSSQAEQWRQLIRQKIAQGESKNQILQHFVEMEGESILASPPKQGFALTVWLFPAFLVLNGAVMILLLARRWASRPALPPQETNTSLPSQTSVLPSPQPANATLASLPNNDFARYQERLRKELDEFNT